MPHFIYLDHAASTPVDKEVLKAMLPFYTTSYASPSSIHAMGRETAAALEKSREIVAKILHAKPEEIIFTSGGTESINLAIKGIAFAKGKGHIITSQIEHPAVLETCQYLETKGFSISYLPSDKFGLISPTAVEKAIRKDTILITLMYANNEIGTVQPIADIGRIAQQNHIPFHSDACQAGLLELNVEKLNADMLTLNGSKIYALKGAGILYKRKSLAIEPLLHGGGQEFGLRSGTPNVAAIVGFAKALEMVQKNKERENRRLSSLRDYLIAKVLQQIPEVRLNGHPRKRLPNNAHFSFQGIIGEELLQHLSEKGIYVSVGSACASGKIEVGHVLKAIAVPEEWARGSIRFSLGRSTTRKELEYAVRQLKLVVGALRKVKA